jgi:NAD(P)-dependent dehydrogenase (short-subunit alcohol dehydrogenase family)
VSSTGAGKAALVTGASSGIGLAIARMLADEGYALTIAARRPDPLAEAADDLRSRGVPVESVAGSLTDSDQVQAVVDRHAQVYGRLDVLVNNAGRGIISPLEDLADKHIDLQIDLNLRSLILFTKRCIPLLRKGVQAGGIAQVVNLSSIAGKIPEANLGVYSAVKAGVIAFTDSMNREFSTEHIRFTALSPAQVDTPLTEPFRATIPIDEMIQVEDIAEAVRYLLGLTRFCVVPEIAFLRPG